MGKKKHKENSALHVKKGISQPPQVNKDAAERFSRMKLDEIPADDYVKGILGGNRSLLSRAITLVESALPRHHQLAQQIISNCLPHAGKSIRVGITGVPGVGKSTFIESLGKYLTGKGHKVAVLAIDPSSSKSKGSILGDKTRMEELANDPNAFIRPSASAGSLGGVARKTRESIILCEAAGFDCIFVETVGVGQSETAVHSMVDFFLLLMLAGAGDELQGIKRGIMEMADAIIINKADGTNKEKADMARREYMNALHLFPAPATGWV
ncbi:MAG TPA: methylmalonyl Co-A mutase-associated GTPase MeaB, partial [Bacteroidales bacterium]|nr:methylmalonyl Co-A mutase-associated GTPase MeaB [Bacteroidales bacterium]